MVLVMRTKPQFDKRAVSGSVGSAEHTSDGSHSHEILMETRNGVLNLV